MCVYDLIRPAAVVWAPPARGRDACYAVLACVCECEMLLRLFWRAEICAMSSSEGEKDAADATLLQWYDERARVLAGRDGASAPTTVA